MSDEIPTPLERAAKATFEAIQRDGGGFKLPWEHPDMEMVRKTYMVGVRATIEALRDVDAGSPLMLIAGREALFCCTADPELADARKCFHAMIDSALEVPQ